MDRLFNAYGFERYPSFNDAGEFHSSTDTARDTTLDEVVRKNRYHLVPESGLGCCPLDQCEVAQ